MYVREVVSVVLLLVVCVQGRATPDQDDNDGAAVLLAKPDAEAKNPSGDSVGLDELVIPQEEEGRLLLESDFQRAGGQPHASFHRRVRRSASCDVLCMARGYGSGYCVTVSYPNHSFTCGRGRVCTCVN